MDQCPPISSFDTIISDISCINDETGITQLTHLNNLDNTNIFLGYCVEYNQSIYYNAILRQCFAYFNSVQKGNFRYYQDTDKEKKKVLGMLMQR